MWLLCRLFVQSKCNVFFFFFQAKTFIFPTDENLIVNIVNFSKIEQNINAKQYLNTESFTSDVKWILHNSVIYHYRKYKRCVLVTCS